MQGNLYNKLFENIERTIAQLKDSSAIDFDTYLKASALRLQAARYVQSFFNLYKLVKSTKPKTDNEIVEVQTAITAYCLQYRKFVNKNATPKLHMIEAHFIPFLWRYRSLWLYAEEGVEAAHAWLGKWRSSTNHVIGAKRKMQRLGDKIQAFQHPQGAAVTRKILKAGRLRKFAPRVRVKLCADEIWDHGVAGN